MQIHIYHSEYFYYIKSQDCPVGCFGEATLLPNSTTAQPMTPAENQIQLYKKATDSWILVDNNMGLWYNKVSKKEINVLNPIADVSQLTRKKPFDFSIWDSVSNNWILDKNAKDKHNQNIIIHKAIELLKDTDYLMHQDEFSALSDIQKSSILEYRISLRNVVNKQSNTLPYDIDFNYRKNIS